MLQLNPQKLVNSEGETTGIVLTKEEFENLVQYIENLEDARILEMASASADDLTPAEDFIGELKRDGLL